MILLDTNVLSELARESPESAVRARSRGARPSQLSTTAITQAEMRLGVALLPSGRRQAQLAAAVEAVLRLCHRRRRAAVGSRRRLDLPGLGAQR